MTAKERSQKTSRAIIVIASILVISALSFFAFEYFSDREKLREANRERIQLENEILDLEQKVLAFSLKNDSQEAELEKKDEDLRQKEDELQRLRAELNKLNARQAQSETQEKELQILRKRVSNMDEMIRQYRTQIRQLLAENQALGEQLDSVRTDLEESGLENDSLLVENQETREELARTRKLGSILKANNFAYSRLNNKGKERNEDESFRRFSMKNLRVCFDILENVIARSGQRDIYLVLENPDGSINTNVEDGYSGTFRYEGRKKEYTAQATINYRKSKINLCIDYYPPEDFKWQKGPQFVRIYSSDGDIIGQGQFEIK